MARKIKPNALFDEPAAEVEPASSSIARDIGADENPIVGTNRKSAEDIEKLEKFDAMEKSLADMSQEKSMLEAKIAEYVAKIKDLSESEQKIAKLESDKKTLEDKCKSLEERCANISKIEKELALTKDENDKYLIKISELTFENANLESQLADINKNNRDNNTVQNQGKFTPARGMQYQAQGPLAQPNTDVYNPYVNNGYGTW